MKKDKFLFALIITSIAVAVIDLAYIIFLACELGFLLTQTDIAVTSFGLISLLIISLNAALLFFAGVYLIFRKQ